MSNDTRSCIFSSFCSNAYCDMSCVKNAVSQILMEKSGLGMNDSVFSSDFSDMQKYSDMLSKLSGKLAALQTKQPNKVADLLTYVSICNMCEGHGSSVTIFHLKFSQYISILKDSWSSGTTSTVREKQAFITNSRILIISGLDYCNLKDFECQTLLTILQDRMKSNMTTVVVVNSVNSLSGSGSFIVPLKDKLKEVLIND